ncbi:MAG: NAD(P)-dependent dehydrogenase (short-subunit alcohol dehydrogenase family) [Paracoccaceae bacterium]
MIGLKKLVTIDYMNQGICCNAICPGTVDTRSLRATNDYEAAMKALAERQPMGTLATTKEIGALVVYLGSDAPLLMAITYH